MRAISRQSGNVLFLILIAVALFAALSYVVTQSTRSGGGNVTNEKMQLAFDHILNHVTAMRTALTRMSINGVQFNAVNACPLSGCDGGAPDGYHYDNSLCPLAGTNNACKLYHPQGGGLVTFDFARLYPELRGTIPAYPDAWKVANIGRGWWTYTAGGGFGEDLIYSVRVTRAFCDYINKRLNLPTVSEATGSGSLGNPTNLGYQWALDGSTLWDLTDDGGAIGGPWHVPFFAKKDMGCWVSTDGYIFSTPVLIR